MLDSQPRDTTGMMGRYVLFLVLSFGILLASLYLNSSRRQADRQGGGQQAQVKPGAQKEGVKKPHIPAEKAEPKPGAPESADKPSPDQAKPEKKAPLKKAPARPPRTPPEPRAVTLGSTDPKSPYRMLAIVTNRGAAVAWIELASSRYSDLEDRRGYLGHLVLDETIQGKGCSVEIVGPGTPAAEAGLKRGDVITALTTAEGDQPVEDFRQLRQVLQTTEPGEEVTLTVLRDRKPVTLPPVQLARRPLEVVRPEAHDPLSFLLTLSKLDSQGLDLLRNKYGELKKEVDKAKENGNTGRLAEFNREIAEIGRELAGMRDEPVGDQVTPTFGDLDAIAAELEKLRPDIQVHLELRDLDLRTGTWNIQDEKKFDAPGPHTEVSFFWELPETGLRITKTYRLAQVPEPERPNADYPAYHLVLDIKIENLGQEDREVAYQLDGPTGLPTEGKWYAYKVIREWGRAGLRDVVHAWQGDVPNTTTCTKIATDSKHLLESPWQEQVGQEEQLLAFIGVDSQYFSSLLIPQRGDSEEVWFDELQPLRVGAVDSDWPTTTNTSCRLISTVHKLKPHEEPLQHAYTIFAGPKSPKLLEQYGARLDRYELPELVYYGWYGWIAKPMLAVLHFFYSLVGNYGLSIAMLTVLVRLCMFPLSRKQALGAEKMKKIQPELKKIQEKYKNNLEARARAQRELFTKHGYHPASGCLVMFVQLPIFVGLYRGLMVDIELRQAPLISHSIRWCSNLSAPDMLFDWSGFWSAIGWNWFNEGQAFYALGPYFNLLPLLTVALFLVQQKILMPAPTDDDDEKARVQRTMMKFMMIFMGLIFFKVASGLCIYFIFSSLWGLAERKLLLKTSHPGSGAADKVSKPEPRRQALAKAAPRSPAPSKPAPPKPLRPRPAPSERPRVGPNPDGSIRRKKKKKRKRNRGRK